MMNLIHVSRRNHLIRFDEGLIHEKYRNIVISAEKFLTAEKL